MKRANSVRRVARALRHARIETNRHINLLLRAGADWHEETVTDIYLAAAFPRVKYVQFNKREEGRVGADWLWWWIDSSGEAFGMLVQAKRLKRVQGRWEVDFAYGNGSQLEKLRRAARVLGVTAGYVVYLGSPKYRHPDWCTRDERHHKTCGPSSVSYVHSLIPALGNTTSAGGADLVANEAKPVEWLIPSVGGGPVLDLNLATCDDELRRFLLEPQTGARGVAREVFRMVSENRWKHFSHAAAGPPITLDEAVFTAMPADTGHWGVSYFADVLRGLWATPPPYVQAMRFGDSIALDLPESVAGVVIIDLADEDLDGDPLAAGDQPKAH